jgi:hypothetical protein
MRIEINTAKSVAMIAIAATGILFSARAQACGERRGHRDLSTLGLPASLFEPQRSPSFSELMPGVTPSDDERAADSHQTSIVGMWTVGFYHPGNVLWDGGMEQFSSDGNEVTNDFAFPPAEGNVCWGVWVRVGKGQYKLRHIGFAFDSNGIYLGRFDLEASFVLNNHGNGFTGKYRSDQEDLAGNIIPDLHDEGTLRGTRFTAD